MYSLLDDIINGAAGFCIAEKDEFGTYFDKEALLEFSKILEPMIKDNMFSIYDYNPYEKSLYDFFVEEAFDGWTHYSKWCDQDGRGISGCRSSYFTEGLGVGHKIYTIHELLDEYHLDEYNETNETDALFDSVF